MEKTIRGLLKQRMRANRTLCAGDDSPEPRSGHLCKGRSGQGHLRKALQVARPQDKCLPQAAGKLLFPLVPPHVSLQCRAPQRAFPPTPGDPAFREEDTHGPSGHLWLRSVQEEQVSEFTDRALEAKVLQIVVCTCRDSSGLNRHHLE